MNSLSPQEGSQTMTDPFLPEYIDGLPNISGSENIISQTMARSGPRYLPESGIDFGRIRSAFAIALHMHQPLIPAGRPPPPHPRRDHQSDIHDGQPAHPRQPQ